MAVDMFMEIDDIEGESVDSVHQGHIDVKGWHWGAHQTGSSQLGSGSGTGKAAVEDLVFESYFEKSTPTLMAMVANGTPFKKATLTVRKAGGQPLEYIKITMTGGIVSNVTHTLPTGGEVPLVSISLNFAAVDIDYTPQAADGTGQPVVSTSIKIATQAH
jgi:type VI secretion system secreted protein Hcp